MSWGVVACSVCRREVHQNGPEDPKTRTHGWTHCEDGTPRCEGSVSAYLSQLSGEPVGRFCNIDQGPDDRG